MVKPNAEEESLLGQEEDTDVSTGESSTINSLSKSIYEDRCEGRFLLYFLVCLLEILGLICVILVCIWTKMYMGGFAWDDGSPAMFNWHPVFMTVGLVVLYGNAAIVYRVFRSTEKFTAKLIHGSLNAGAFIFAVLGIYAVFAFHDLHKIPNMYSLHSWVGMVAILMYGCQLLLGFLAFLFPKFSDNGRKIYLDIHVYFGITVLLLVIAACISGITEKMLFAFKPIYAKFPRVGIIANAFGIFLVLFAVVLGYILQNRNWKRITP